MAQYRTANSRYFEVVMDHIHTSHSPTLVPFGYLRKKISVEADVITAMGSVRD